MVYHSEESDDDVVTVLNLRSLHPAGVAIRVAACAALWCGCVDLTQPRALRAPAGDAAEESPEGTPIGRRDGARSQASVDATPAADGSAPVAIVPVDASPFDQRSVDAVGATDVGAPVRDAPAGAMPAPPGNRDTAMVGDAAGDAPAAMPDAPASQTDGGLAGAADGGLALRNPLKWPFVSNSIWNIPIGSAAMYAPANLVASDIGPGLHENLISMVATAPVITVYNKDAANSAGCSIGVMPRFSVPLPTDVLALDDNGFNTFALLDVGGRTVKGGNKFFRCTAGAAARADFYDPADGDIRGDGLKGGEPQSGMSSLGGVIRVGELLPGTPPIRHALKFSLSGKENLAPCAVPADCFRWPAKWSDTGAWDLASPLRYGGGPRAMRMGSLLAIPATVAIATLGLETEPARNLAFTLQNYGAYVAGNRNYRVYAFVSEMGPAGNVAAEFQAAWGFAFSTVSTDNPWARDQARLLAALLVVDNNTVSTPGGGGIPLAPLAPALAP